MSTAGDTLQASGTRGASAVAAAARERGPWFHNLHLDDGTWTAADHPLGDFPANKWRTLAPALPTDLAGWRVLDIGCNAGFYSFELARRGATVTAIEHDPRYLAQARWASGHIRVPGTIDFRRADVYELAHWDEHFDLIVFMGVFYHLRYPLLACDTVRRLLAEDGLLLFQTLTSDRRGSIARSGLGLRDRGELCLPGWPAMAFIETDFAGDPSNWWIPNQAAVGAILREAGLEIIATPAHEIALCRSQTRPDPAQERAWATAVGRGRHDHHHPHEEIPS